MKRIKHWPGVVITAVLLALLCGVGRTEEKAAEPDYFPLAKGNYWIYEGESSWVQKNPKTGENEVKSGKMKWKMEIVETAVWQRLFAALIKGFPSDLAWYKPGKERGDYLIVRMGTGNYYLYQGVAALQNWEKIRKEKEPEEKGAELLLDAPLIPGKTFGGEFTGQVHGRYCWVVEGYGGFDPKDVRGAPPLKKPRCFNLAYYTTPDHAILDFVPGLGITGYTYGHHGTTAETELSLVEVGTAKE